MNVYRGEKRYLAVELAALLAVDDSFTGDPLVSVIFKRGRESADFVTDDPSSPEFFEDTEARFWVEVPVDAEIGNYLIVVDAQTTNGEVVVQEAPLVVQ